MKKTIRFVWFWTFWHWSREASQAGLLQNEPLAGIADHWNEWFGGVASEQDREAIRGIGRERGAQSQFLVWLFRHWAKEVHAEANRSAPRFAAGQLARVQPFITWESMRRFRSGYGAVGVPAVILSEHSNGKATDVRAVEALVLPAQNPAHRGQVTPEGFKANITELRLPIGLAREVLGGKGRHMLLLFWLMAGRRAYGRPIAIALTVGWLFVVGLLMWLLLGPDPGEQLPIIEGVLLCLWGSLATTALWTAWSEARNLWREGAAWSRRLGEGETRLRADIGLTVEGGSAGLAFALNAMLASYRSGSGATPRSWIWRCVFKSLDHDGRKWAATGIVTPQGWIRPVVLAPKLRACFQHPGISSLLTPVQRGASRAAVENVRDALSPSSPDLEPPSVVASGTRYGFASQTQNLRVQPCRHLSQALMAVGGLSSRCQLAANAIALTTTAFVCAAMADLRSTLLPPSPPMVIRPVSPSPYYLWVSLDTPRAEDFRVVLESRYWTNRRTNVVQYSGPNASNRAEIRLLRFSHARGNNPEDGTIWVERRRKFLWRDYTAGERVGQFTLPYLYRLGRE